MKGGGSKKSYRKYVTPVETGKPYGQVDIFDPCSSLTIETTLQNIQPAWSKVRVNDKLPISLNSKQILVHSTDGDFVGNIVSTKNSALINCIEKGNNYVAKVKSSKGEILVQQTT